MKGLLRHSSTILTVIGSIGVIATAISAVKAAPKANELIDKAKKEKGEELTKEEIIKVTWKTYIPTAAMATGTLVCILGANVLNKRQQAALVSAYTLIDSSYKKYKHKLVELYGEETHNAVVDAIAVEKAKEVGITASCLGSLSCLTDEEACGDPVLFYDSFGHRYFESTIEQVIAAEYHFNRNYTLRGMALLNELYEFLGLDLTEYGGSVGWCVEDEIYWVDFNHRKTVLDDGMEVYIIETAWGPTAEILEYYW